VDKNVRFLTFTAILLALTGAFQMMGLPQYFTGPVVNAMLYLATLTVGMESGILIGLFTPWVALIRGILPSPAQPMAPFIMVANATLVVVFGLLKRFNPWVAMIAASLCKYGNIRTGTEVFPAFTP